MEARSQITIGRWANVATFSLINGGYWLAIRRWANVGERWAMTHGWKGVGITLARRQFVAVEPPLARRPKRRWANVTAHVGHTLAQRRIDENI